MKCLILFLLIALLPLNIFSQDPEKELIPAFQQGEHLHYKLEYGIFTAAEADLQIQTGDTKYEGKPVYHIIADGKTTGTFDVFFKVRNRYESYIDCNTLLPV